MAKIYISFATFYHQLWASTPRGTKFFSYFWLQPVGMKNSKKPCMVFDYIFTFWDIGLCFIFVSFENGNTNMKILYNIKATHFSFFFWEIAGTVLLSGYFLKCALPLKELHQRFFELRLQYCTLTENFLRRLIWYCNFNPPTRLNNHCMKSVKIRSFFLVRVFLYSDWIRKFTE